MGIELERIEFRGNFLNVFRNKRMALGFTEIGFTGRDLAEYFPGTTGIELKQVHSNRILCSGRIRPETEGDGIILEERKKMAIIKTADCVPLFFWHRDFTEGGILHVGWKGLEQKIELALIKDLKNRRRNPKDFRFFLGPAIESECYPVGREVFLKFYRHFYRDQVFFHRADGQYSLDIKAALRLSLVHSGTTSDHIMDSKICTFCQQNRFPSYRRERGIKDRIFNFLVFF